MCSTSKRRVHVFDFEETGAMKRICSGESLGTLIHDGQTNLAP
ncbi:hypothetical protein [Exiguobacterium aurantiacum]